jgi:hypothetical protein
MKSQPFYRLAFFCVLAFSATCGIAGAENSPAPKDPAATTTQKTSWLGPELLYSTYQTMRPELNTSPLGEPFNLKAQVFNELTLGDVYAVVPYPYDLLATTLTVPEQVCHAIVLHINVKGCVIENDGQLKPLVDLYIGRKEYQHPDQAFKVQYKFSVSDPSDKYTLISMTADSGPLNTENIAIHIEFLPIDTKTSFVHFTYSANYVKLARFALNAYLSTLGRNKVGFSEIGIDKQGDPVYIKGIQGVIERNTMRYFFALHSFFSTYHEPENQRFDASLNRWFDYVEKYPRQLQEVPREDYIKAKHHEQTDIGELNLSHKGF